MNVKWRYLPPKKGRPGLGDRQWMFDLSRCVCPLLAGKILAFTIADLPCQEARGRSLACHSLLPPPAHPRVIAKGGEAFEVSGAGAAVEGKGVKELRAEGASR